MAQQSYFLLHVFTRSFGFTLLIYNPRLTSNTIVSNRFVGRTFSYTLERLIVFSVWWEYLNPNLLHNKNEELTVLVYYTRGLSIKWSNKVSRFFIGIRIFFSRHLTEPKIAVENVYRPAITGVIVLSAAITKVKSGLLSVAIELRHIRHELGVSGQNDAHQNYTLVIGLKD